MAIKINRTLTTEGLTIPVGAIGIISYTSPFTTYTKDDQGNITPIYNGSFALRFYKDLASYKNDERSYIKGRIDEIKEADIIKMSKSEAVALTAIDVENRIKEWSESQLGVGTCEIIDLFP